MATFDNSRVVFCFAGGGVRIGFLMLKIVNYINFFCHFKAFVAKYLVKYNSN